MKHPITLCLAAGPLLFMTSCSCAIYREEFTPLEKGSVLTEGAVRKAAVSSGFSQRPGEDGHARFEKDDVELLYDSAADVMIFRSSFCPLFPVHLDAHGWQSDCESITNQVVHYLNKDDMRLRKLSSEEQIKRNQD